MYNPLIFQSSSTSDITKGKQETVKISKLLNYHERQEESMRPLCFSYKRN